ncbi:hypothetical protein Lepto7375DRAFT_2603 [Leptolyngbya sp. PCC 7375]|nr:hypothetical protein Lepto7375DRAFT_2603 [Leptolyngbya sp. PCC 7375]
MTKAYIVVEGPHHIKILRALIEPALLQDVTFVDGEDKYNADPLARTLLSERQIPTVLVVDADTNNEIAIESYQQDLEFLSHTATVHTPYKILQAVPTIETVFLQDRTLVEECIGRPLSPLEWQLGQKQPRDLLAQYPKGVQAFIEHTLHNLTEQKLQTLRQHPLIQEITGFLATQVHPSNPALAS